MYFSTAVPGSAKKQKNSVLPLARSRFARETELDEVIGRKYAPLVSFPPEQGKTQPLIPVS